MAQVDVLQRGAWLRWEGVTWRVFRLVKSTVHVENPLTGEISSMSVADWEAGCRDRTVEHVSEPGSDLDEKTRALLRVSVPDLPDSMKATALRKFDYVQAFLDPDSFYQHRRSDVVLGERVLTPMCSPQSLRPLLRHVAEARGDKVPPGVSTFCKWRALFQAAGGDSRALASKYHLRGPRGSFMKPRMEEILNQVIDTVWLQMHGPSKKKVYQVLNRRVTEWNEANPSEKLVMLTARHVMRYIKANVDQRTMVLRRRGKKAADREFKNVGVCPEASHILDEVEIDHTTLDIEVLDDEHGLPLGRPTVTTLLDRHSRMILAAHISFDGPGLTAVLQAIRQAILPKDFLKEICPELQEAYPGYGRMVALLSDHGAEFMGEYMRQVSTDLDISTYFARVGRPEDKGKIERFFKTMQMEVSHSMPGARPPLVGSKDPEARTSEARIRFSEFVSRTWRWIVGVYAREFHRGIGTTPLQKWEESAAERPLRAPMPTERLDVLLARVEERTVQRTGIEWRQLRWSGPVLERIRAQPGFDPRRTKVRVRFDDQDLGRAWVTDPVTKLAEPLVSTSPEYASGLSLHQHRVVLAIAKERYEGTLDDKVLLESRALLDQERDELLRQGHRGSRKARKAQARFDGVGSKGPGVASGNEDAVPVEHLSPAAKGRLEAEKRRTTPADDGHVLVGPGEERDTRLIIKNVRKK